MDLVKKVKRAYICVSVAMGALGILMILMPGISARLLCVIVGIMLLVFGGVKLIGFFSRDPFRLAFQFDLGLGLLTISAGLIMVLLPEDMSYVLPVLIGAGAVIDGAFKFQTAFDARSFGLPYWWWILILACLTAAAGVLLIIDPFAGRTALMLMAGAALLAGGVQNLFVVLYTVRAYKIKDEF